jgi:glutathione synthase/RimK-type ligase-like ATP-grasp enzyme
MPTLGLLTCQRLPNLFEADQALIPLFKQRGITAQAVIWNDPTVDWRKFDHLVIRNTWDYYTQSDAFINWLKSIRDQQIPMLNPVDVVLRNLHKFYLRDFEYHGVRIIPTLFSEKSAPVSFRTLAERQWDRVVIKPAISAGSYLTKTFVGDELDEKTFDNAVSGSDWLVQPFVPEIERQGELSMIFFNGKFSHAVVKKPKDGDFRVQRQYGGKYELVEPGEALVELGRKIVSQIPQSLLYARVDGVLINEVFHLMELELIEPDLYFEFGEGIKERFVDAIIDRLEATNTKPYMTNYKSNNDG